MSRAGKFIPGGSKGKRTGPIRAPEPGAPAGGDGSPPSGDGKRKLLTVGGINKKISKSQKWPVTIMGAAVLCLLCSVAWYEFGYLPMKQNAEAAAAAAKANADALQEEKDKEAKEAHDREMALQAAKGTVSVDSNPSGAKVTIGDVTRTTPAKIDDLPPSDYDVTIQMDGYEDYKTKVTVTPTSPVDLGTVNLVQKAGSINLVSPQSNVTYTLTGPNGYSHEGAIPDKLDQLPIGDYQLTATQGSWSLPPMQVTVSDQVTTDKDVKFPYAKVTITSTPPGATVRQGRVVLGTTPVTLPPVRPTELHLTVDLPPYTIQTVDLHVGDFQTITKNVPMPAGRDFIAACGMPMVWIADDGYWAAKYPFRQRDFEKVAGYNPSFFRGPNLPVETISWESAQAFIQKLNEYETAKGKVPAGFHYSLPTESQWEQFNDDADITTAAISSNTPLSSTQNVGYSAPNKYGLYDTLGNVWEWCEDSFDDKGDHSLRGGTWLSLPENFPNAAARQGGPPKDAEKFIGFRVVLEPNS
jgi:formylglycine-generating enzyme required for sulfatase activity